MNTSPAVSIANDLAQWAVNLQPSSEDMDLAARSLLDTVAVTIAGRNQSATKLSKELTEGGHWAVAAHILDFDDLHMESTTHISAVCVPTILTMGGKARDYLAAAGVMARLGVALGWSHYSSGWHSTCTAGAPAAAVGAGIILGLGADQLAIAMALAVPGAGGNSRAFGTDSKSLQVGFAVETGVRAAHLAAAGATADVTAVDEWLGMVGGDLLSIDLTGEAIPGGLATKVYPCCYAMQRPISALAELRGRLDPSKVTKIILKTPEATVAPLIHHQPTTGLQAKFSLEYAVATALLDSHQGFSSFTDDAIQRQNVQDLIDLVEVQLTPGGDWLLAGEFEAEVQTADKVLRISSKFPLGSPQRPISPAQLRSKVEDCLSGTSVLEEDINWESASSILRSFPSLKSARSI